MMACEIKNRFNRREKGVGEKIFWKTENSPRPDFSSHKGNISQQEA